MSSTSRLVYQPSATSSRRMPTGPVISQASCRRQGLRRGDALAGAALRFDARFCFAKSVSTCSAPGPALPRAVDHLELDHGGIDQHLAAILEIHRDALADHGLDHADAPVRLGGVAHQRAGNEKRIHGGSPHPRAACGRPGVADSSKLLQPPVDPRVIGRPDRPAGAAAPERTARRRRHVWVAPGNRRPGARGCRARSAISAPCGEACRHFPAPCR